MALIRILLIGLAVFLVVRSFMATGDRSGSSSGISGQDKKDSTKKVSKKIGEYVDYEEVKK